MIMPMVSNMIGCVVNIVLDPILIFGLLGAPEMGVIGAAVATVIGQACGCAAVFYCVIKKQNIIHISFKNFKFSWTTIKDIYVVALPGMVMQAIPSFVNIFLNMILITFSVTAVSVMGVYFRLQSFVFMPVFGLCQGSMPIMGYNYGARNRKRLVHTIHLTLKVSITIMAIGLIIFQLFPDQLLAIFDASPQMLHMGRNAMRLLSICFVPAAIGVSFSNLFQALGHGIYSLIMTLIRQLFVILPVAYFLSQAIGVDGVWASFPIAEAAGLTTAILFYRHVYRKEISVLPDGND